MSLISDKLRPMKAEEARERILTSLRRELRKKWGRLGGIAEEIGRSPSYLSKICTNTLPVTLERLLEILQALEVEPADFFGEALDIVMPEPDRLLQDIEGGGPIDRALPMLEVVAERLDGPVRASPPSVRSSRRLNWAALVDKMARCTLSEQRRRMRTAARYRHPSFVRPFLEYLDALRYDSPRDASRLTETVVRELLSTLDCEVEERLTFFCRALGIFGSAHRILGHYPTAARAQRMALVLARQHGLTMTVADLLQRSAYVLADHGEYQRALVILREALEIYFDHESAIGVGRVLYDRGYVFNYLGEHEAAITSLQRSLDYLQGESPLVRRNRLAAYLSLSCAYEELEDPDAAERWLKEAIDSFSDEGDLVRAHISWRYGLAAMAKEEYGEAVERLRSARQILDAKKSPIKAGIIALDLISSLLGSKQEKEAKELAMGMAEYLVFFRKDRAMEAALFEFVDAVSRGRLSQDLVAQLRKTLEKRRIPSGMHHR